MDAAPRARNEHDQRSAFLLAAAMIAKPLRWRILESWLAIAVTLSSIPFSRAHAQLESSHSVAVAGTVRDSSGRPITSALVAVSTLTARPVTQTIRTNDEGEFRLALTASLDSVQIAVRALGYVPLRSMTASVERSIDVVLVPLPVRLGDVHVQATRRGRATPADRMGSAPGNEQRSVGLPVAPGSQGDLGRMASYTPGVVPAGDGAQFSVLGLQPDQNRTTLNGLSVDLARVPRDAVVLPSVITSQYDPANGGFSGAQLALQTFPAAQYSQRTMRVTVAGPATSLPGQRGPSVQRRGGPEVDASGQLAGSLLGSKRYNISWQVGGTTAPSAAYNLDASPNPFTDSVRTILGPQRTRPRTQANGALIGRADFRISPESERYLVFIADGHQTTGGLQAENALPSHDAELSNGSGAVQYRQVGYHRGTLLSDLQLGLTGQRTSISPTGSGPELHVLAPPTGSQAGSATDNAQPLDLLAGSNAAARLSNTDLGGELREQLGWKAGANRHEIRLTGSIQAQRSTSRSASNSNGTYFFESATALAAGTATRFTRLLDASNRSAAVLATSLALGDQWRRSDHLQVQYGARVDVTTTDRRTLSPSSDVGTALSRGTRLTDVGLSPRLGLLWNYGRASRVSSPFGNAPRGSFRAGIGAFRSTPTATGLLEIAQLTSAAPGYRVLECIGSDAPTWSVEQDRDPASIPSQCAAGSGSPSTNGLREVTGIARGFHSPVSWRANLGWSTPFTRYFRITLDGTASLGLNQRSRSDINLRNNPEATVLGENGRLLFAPPSAYDTNTGMVGLEASRTDTRFGRVMEIRSDGQTAAVQAAVTVRPSRYSPTSSWSVSYMWGKARSRMRGYDGTTAGDPRRLFWGWSPFDVRNQFAATGTWLTADALQWQVAGRLLSGLPYTPMIGTDINGDGVLDDRAIIPSVAGGADVPAGLADLIAASPRRTRDCIQKAVGRVPGTGECRGPIAGWVDLGIMTVPGRFGLPSRARVTLALSNVVAGVDALMHSGRAVGWGQPMLPDPVLLYPTAFDSTAKVFKYRVNPSFGSPGSHLQLAMPFQVTLGLRWELGASIDEQAARSQLARTRTTASPERVARIRDWYAQSVMNPLPMVIAARDTLPLTDAQAARLSELSDSLDATLNRIWTDLANQLIDQDAGGGQRAETYAVSVRAARSTAYDALAATARKVRETLTTDQLDNLPFLFRSMLDEEGIRILERQGDAEAIFR